MTKVNIINRISVELGIDYKTVRSGNRGLHEMREGCTQ